MDINNSSSRVDINSSFWNSRRKKLGCIADNRLLGYCSSSCNKWREWRKLGIPAPERGEWRIWINPTLQHTHSPFLLHTQHCRCKTAHIAQDSPKYHMCTKNMTTPHRLDLLNKVFNFLCTLLFTLGSKKLLSLSHVSNPKHIAAQLVDLYTLL